MKQSAAKTLGVAALGVAFAAAGAGAANAAAAPVVPAPAALGTLASALPVGQMADTRPEGGAESVAARQGALLGGMAAARPTAEGAVQSLTSTEREHALGAVLDGLPVNGSGLNGMPL
ncbi:ATP-binding protein [Streptomyces sp. NPDC050703]|uniref:ATP-binding protein n=1 Tax=Streptomyces sp. NPDC050703 TaxID=3157218 RepID=UPI0034385838